MYSKIPNPLLRVDRTLRSETITRVQLNHEAASQIHDLDSRYAPPDLCSRIRAFHNVPLRVLN